MFSERQPKKYVHICIQPFEGELFHLGHIKQATSRPLSHEAGRSEARFHRCLPASHSVIPVLVKLLPPCFFPLQGFITDPQWKASYFRVNKVKYEKLVLICPLM